MYRHNDIHVVINVLVSVKTRKSSKIYLDKKQKIIAPKLSGYG